MEDFHEKAIELEVRMHESIIVSSGYTVEQITTAIVNMANAFEVVVTTAAEQMNELAKWFDEYNFELQEYFEQESKREVYKLDFTRTIIRHQVLTRKPKMLIKKVIH